MEGAQSMQGLATSLAEARLCLFVFMQRNRWRTLCVCLSAKAIGSLPPHASSHHHHFTPPTTESPPLLRRPQKSQPMAALPRRAVPRQKEGAASVRFHLSACLCLSPSPSLFGVCRPLRMSLHIQTYTHPNFNAHSFAWKRKKAEQAALCGLGETGRPIKALGGKMDDITVVVARVLRGRGG